MSEPIRFALDELEALTPLIRPLRIVLQTARESGTHQVSGGLSGDRVSPVHAEMNRKSTLPDLDYDTVLQQLDILAAT